jgi:hypothetical protein
MEGNNQPGQFATFPVHQPDQAQVRRMVEEDRKRKKKKTTIIAVSCVLVLVLAGVGVLLYFLLSGGGMTPAEYQQKVLPEHQKVMEALEDVKVEWKNAYYDVFVNNTNTDPYKQGCAQMIGEVDKASATIEEAITVLEGITPPKETETLQADLLAYYRDAQRVFAKVKDMYQYLPALAAVFGGMDAEIKALPELGDSASLAEMMANMDAGMVVVIKYRDQLTVLAPTSAECQQISATLLDYFNTMVGLNEQFYAAANSFSIGTMETLVDQIGAEEDTFQQNAATMLLPLETIATEYAQFVEKGEGYTAQLEDLTVKK